MYRDTSVCAHLALITKFENKFRELSLAPERCEGIVPVRDRQGRIVAYAVHGTIVRVLGVLGGRQLSCTRCNGHSCHHVADAKKYERTHVADYTYATNGVSENDKDTYLEAKDSA